MQKTWLWLVIAAVVSGCATLVSDDLPPAYVANAAKAASGIVLYNPDGIKEIVDARQNDAFRKIFEFCGSRQYKIVKQVTVAAETAPAGNSLATFGADKVIELHFVCE